MSMTDSFLRKTDTIKTKVLNILDFYFLLKNTLNLYRTKYSVIHLILYIIYIWSSLIIVVAVEKIEYNETEIFSDKDLKSGIRNNAIWKLIDETADKLFLFLLNRAHFMWENWN